jgi:hypothetical protein
MKYLVLSLSIAIATVAIIGCKMPVANNLPPADMLAHPGPGVGGPGPGVIAPCGPMGPQCMPVSQLAFIGPEGMQVQWDISYPGAFDSQPLVCPARYNFPQAAIYRLKLTNIPGRAGVELYPTVEVAPAMPRSEAFIAHNAIPVQFTEEDFDQVLSGNFVTKVVYLPDPEFQELALAGVETLVSTRLDPGLDPVVEADRRGAILAIVRLGNKDLQIPGDVSAQNGMAGPCMGNPGFAPGYVAGMTVPPYGMPMVGTPIGLPGPPHIPLGSPAGLYRQEMVNHTAVHLPHPTGQVRIDVKQSPGYSYPQPVSHITVVEKSHSGPDTVGATPCPVPPPCPQPGQQ